MRSMAVRCSLSLPLARVSAKMVRSDHGVGDRMMPSTRHFRWIASRPPISEKPTSSDSLYVRRLWDVLFEDDEGEVDPSIGRERTYTHRNHKPVRPVRRARPPQLEPYGALEAPSLVEDERLNLMDWRNNRDLAVALGDNVILVSNEKDNRDLFHVSELVSVEYENGPVTSVAWAPPNTANKHRIAVGLNSGRVQLWDTSSSSSPRLLRTFRGIHTGPVCSLSWNGNILTTGGMDGLIANMDVRARGRKPSIKHMGHSGKVCGLRWSRSGFFSGNRTLASGGTDGIVHIWDLRTASYYQRFEDHRSTVKALAWSPTHDDILASGGGATDRTVKFWNAKTGALLNSTDVGSRVHGLAWSPDGEELLSCGDKLSVWDYPEMRSTENVVGSGSPVISMSQSRDGFRLATLIGNEKELILWNTFGSQRRASLITEFSSSSHSTISNGGV